MNGRRPGERHRLVSALAFALVLATTAGAVAQQADDLLPAAALVVLGGCLVGGIVPSRWWLSAVVGLGVPLARLWAPLAPGGTATAGSTLSAWMAPVVALAAGGLGAALLRHVREE